ncbi:STAS-like domain-containing protein [Muricauda oceani]|uniref:STAS-like domain-containing protein n=1 Tax=Flagellimonas oceani TaxID=2698672 RepID=A0A6G7J667_9FLAO|nr:STAS-like domain-containing protein [Allomuricauda oceani]MBW8242536.1 STAS-like domain-containing protein [Allomuricauda oceani]QII46296.1 STAS-like domain-containing protein [Allomuricauda oceani]
MAARLRDDVMLDIDEIDRIIFDFEGVNVITNSFANEYFGKMIERISVEKFRNKFAFINDNDFIQRVLISSF